MGTIAHPPVPLAIPISHQIAIPGSGMTPIAFPSPGKYEIAKAGDKIKRNAPKTQSVFQSQSQRFQNPKSSQPGLLV